MEVEGDSLQMVEWSCYLGEMLSCEAGAETAVGTRMAAAWRKRRKLASLLVNTHCMGHSSSTFRND